MLNGNLNDDVGRVTGYDARATRLSPLWWSTQDPIALSAHPISFLYTSGAVKAKKKQQNNYYFFYKSIIGRIKYLRPS